MTEPGGATPRPQTLAEEIRAIFTEARKTSERTPRYGISDAHGCVRAKVYSFRHFEETKEPVGFERPARWGLAAACGTGVGGVLEEAARRLGHSSQVPAVMGEITGHCDILLVGEHVIDVKVKGEYGWRQIQKEADPDETRQVGTYAHILERPKWGLLYIRGISIFKSGDDPEWLLHEGAVMPEYPVATAKFWAEVRKHLGARTLPERLPPGSFQCRTCPHLHCWEIT